MAAHNIYRFKRRSDLYLSVFSMISNLETIAKNSGLEVYVNYPVKAISRKRNLILGDYEYENISPFENSNTLLGKPKINLSNFSLESMITAFLRMGMPCFSP